MVAGLVFGNATHSAIPLPKLYSCGKFRRCIFNGYFCMDYINKLPKGTFDSLITFQGNKVAK